MNRPGLSRITYRVGDYTSFRQKLFEKINQSPALRAWTYRGSDDPGIALLEGGAMVADVLAAYQEVFANESFLRTAQWEKNITGLTRLLGDRAHPGCGGRAYFSLEIRKGADIPLRKSFPLVSDLEELEEPVHWESLHELTLIPELSRVPLESPKDYFFPLTSERVAGQDFTLSCLVKDFKETLPSFKLFIDSQEPGLAGDLRPSSAAEHLGGEVSAYLSAHKEGERWLLQGVPLQNLSTALPAARRALFLASAHAGNGTLAGIASELAKPVKNVFAFDGVDANLIPGDLVLLQTSNTEFKIRRVEQVRVTVKMPSQNTTSLHTLLLLDQEIHASEEPAGTLAIGGMTLWKIKSPWFQIAARDPRWIPPAAAQAGVEYLVFKGEELHKSSLDQRKVGFVKEKGPAEVVTLKLEDASKNLFKLSPKLSADFTYDDFAAGQKKVLCLGNILEMSQGQSEPATVIGSGDSREKHQTMAVPKFPLTYVPSPEDPARLSPELEVRVQGRLWTRVESFLFAEADAEVYIVREDLEGRSWIQFGDGVNGARLPTGADNVTAAFRHGVGAQGPLRRDTQPRSGEKIDRLEKIRQLGAAWGGKAAASAQDLKHTAPQKIRSLGRLVSLDDYEAEVRKIPGVLQVLASWGGIFGEGQNIDFLVFADSEEALSENRIRAAIVELDRKSGLQRLNVNVSFGVRREAYLYALLQYDPKQAVKTELEKAARLKLGVWEQNKPPEDGGLFSRDQRTFGQNEYRTRIQALLQDLPGVRSVKVCKFGTYDKGVSLPPLLNIQVDTGKTEAPLKTAIDPREWLALRGDQTLLIWSET